jgi:hypothetical protein
MLIPNQLVLCFAVLPAPFIIGYNSSTVHAIQNAQPGTSPAKYAEVVVCGRRSLKLSSTWRSGDEEDTPHFQKRKGGRLKPLRQRSYSATTWALKIRYDHAFPTFI